MCAVSSGHSWNRFDSIPAIFMLVTMIASLICLLITIYIPAGAFGGSGCCLVVHGVDKTLPDRPA